MDTWNVEYLEYGVWMDINDHPHFMAYGFNPVYTLREALEIASYLCDYMDDDRIQIICPDNTII